MDIDTETPGLMAVKLSDMIASTWNAYSAIYGFEVRIAVSGENNQKAKWEAGSLASAVSECYALAKR